MYARFEPITCAPIITVSRFEDVARLRVDFREAFSLSFSCYNGDYGSSPDKRQLLKDVRLVSMYSVLCTLRYVMFICFISTRIGSPFLSHADLFVRMFPTGIGQ